MRNYILINLSFKGIKAKHQNMDLSERLNHVQLYLNQMNLKLKQQQQQQQQQQKPVNAVIK